MRLFLVIIIIIIIIILINITSIKELFINIKNIKWMSTNSSSCKNIYVNKNKIYKKYSNPSTVKNIKSIRDKYLADFDFVPKMEFDLDNNIIIEDYYKRKLSRQNKPQDYKLQLQNIDKKFKSKNIYHNDYRLLHFFVDNNKIKLIDFNNVSADKPLEHLKKRNNINRIINRLK